MAHEKNHDYHILNPSVWPLVAAVAAFTMLFGAVQWMHNGIPWIFVAGFVGVLVSMFYWWAEAIKESHAGDHTPVVRIGLRYGFIMFIMSEVMFFAAWFWSFFKNAIYPMSDQSPAVDGVWPPVGIETFDPWHLPLINTLILLCSGCAATWAHHALVHENNRPDIKNGLLLAVGLGVLFTVFQVYEYYHASFGFGKGCEVYCSNFILPTMFHGLHVVIGTIFLLVCYFRARVGHFTPEKHIGFEAAAWYWHFVDVVWLFLFAAVYIWGV
ncbi:MAG: cytochrome c oxidase subunit 3 [Pseudomonadota bacterium]